MKNMNFEDLDPIYDKEIKKIEEMLDEFDNQKKALSKIINLFEKVNNKGKINNNKH